jgi:glycerate dehydrogenase
MSISVTQKPKIVFLDARTTNPGDISFNAISSLGNFTAYEFTSHDELEQRAGDADIVIVNKFPVNQAALDVIRKCKYIVVAATGYNNIQMDAVQRAGICVSNVRGYSAYSVAQHVFASIFTWLNRQAYYHEEVRKGRWSQGVDFCFYDHTIQELEGMVMGIIGYGAIGSKVGALAHAMGMHVISVPGKSGTQLPSFVQPAQLNDVFSYADILTLHCPLNEETKEMVCTRTLSMMKKEAFLINTGRGGLVNEDDLYHALQHNIIAGAALDVLQEEPPAAGNLLINHPKCYVTPHQAWAGQNARIKLVDGIAANIKAYLTGNIMNQVF